MSAALSTAGEPREQPQRPGNSLSAHRRRSGRRGCGRRSRGASLARKEDGATALGSDGDAARDDRAECSETERERRTACGISHVCGVSSTTQVNEPTSQEQTHNRNRRGCQGGGGGTGSLGLAVTSSTDTRQGPAVQNRELSASCDRRRGKRICN